jgi:hypothetical protein
MRLISLSQKGFIRRLETAQSQQECLHLVEWDSLLSDTGADMRIGKVYSIRNKL